MKYFTEEQALELGINILNAYANFIEKSQSNKKYIGNKVIIPFQFPWDSDQLSPFVSSLEMPVPNMIVREIDKNGQINFKHISLVEWARLKDNNESS